MDRTICYCKPWDLHHFDISHQSLSKKKNNIHCVVQCEQHSLNARSRRRIKCDCSLKIWCRNAFFNSFFFSSCSEKKTIFVGMSYMLGTLQISWHLAVVCTYDTKSESRLHDVAAVYLEASLKVWAKMQKVWKSCRRVTLCSCSRNVVFIFFFFCMSFFIIFVLRMQLCE